jgi:hypothetical protein
MVIFQSVAEYIDSCTSLDAKIAAMDAVIDKLMIASIAAAESGHIDEYWFDDGHVKIRSKYRNPADMQASITSFERLRQMYINRKYGYVTRLMDQSNFHGR